MISCLTCRRSLLAAVFAAAGAAMLPLTGLRGAATEEPWTAPARSAKVKNPIPSDEASIAAGKVSYVRECFSCHGTTGRGDGPGAKALEKNPGDLSKPTMWDQTDGALFWKITDGRKPMPSFDKTLSEEQRWQVVNYIRTLAPKPATPPAAQP